jgi:hypothetical protein
MAFTGIMYLFMLRSNSDQTPSRKDVGRYSQQHQCDTENLAYQNVSVVRAHSLKSGETSAFLLSYQLLGREGSR